MPITARAIKKLQHDRIREIENAAVRQKLAHAVRQVRKSPTPKKLQLAYQLLDKAAKHAVIHTNKAARLKSRLARLLKK